MKSLTWVSLLTVAALSAATWYAPEFPIRRHDAPIRHDTAHDPRLGTTLNDLASLETDALGRAIPRSGGRDLVVKAGACSGCSLNSVKYSKLPVESFSRIFVIYQSSPLHIVEATADMNVPDRVFLLADESGEIEERLNAKWIGRWYVLEQGRLARMQRGLDDVSWGE